MTIQVKRGSRVQLTLAAATNGIVVGQPYLITDESRLAVGTAVNAFQAMAKEGEGGGGGGLTQNQVLARGLGC